MPVLPLSRKAVQFFTPSVWIVRGWLATSGKCSWPEMHRLRTLCDWGRPFFHRYQDRLVDAAWWRHRLLYGSPLHPISSHPDKFYQSDCFSVVFTRHCFFVGDYYNDDAIYPKNLSRLYRGTKTMAGLLTVTVRQRLCCVRGLGAWEQDGLPSLYKLKEAFDQETKFQPGLVEWDMMSPTTGNGGVNALFPR